ncbi:MAG: uracil-DNA glycosylase family protein [Muribaculaceae bacterium]
MIETHPWAPWIPEGAKVLFLGSFPPPENRWAMDFYYPNRTNDFWKVMGIIFAGSDEAFYDRDRRLYRLDAIHKLLADKGIALSDAARKVRRQKGNASDKFLEVVEPVNLVALVESMPCCRAIAVTGEKAATVIASLTGTPVPSIGCHVPWTTPDGKDIAIWRLPSTSRAYPMSPLKKAEAYRLFLRAAGIEGA